MSMSDRFALAALVILAAWQAAGCALLEQESDVVLRLPDLPGPWLDRFDRLDCEVRTADSGGRLRRLGAGSWPASDRLWLGYLNL